MPHLTLNGSDLIADSPTSVEEITKGHKYFVAGGGDGGTILELEASYYYPLNDNVAIVPAFYAIFNPNNFDSNPNIYVGNFRAQFSF
ncbi:MAG: carbohydrate porin [Trichocoleus desertorum ATA4-8-CV12]|nr:carbohydrate porin [Trichocoleus desertorum ATA4-8-CV12]